MWQHVTEYLVAVTTCVLNTDKFQPFSMWQHATESLVAVTACILNTDKFQPLSMWQQLAGSINFMLTTQVIHLPRPHISLHIIFLQITS
jgi:uncharacterized membrane protein YagU involved in acid resistance